MSWRPGCVCSFHGAKLHKKIYTFKYNVYLFPKCRINREGQSLSYYGESAEYKGLWIR